MLCFILVVSEMVKIPRAKVEIQKLKKKHFFTDTSGNYLILNMAVWWDYVSKRERGRGGEGGIDEQPLSDKPPLIRCGKTYSTWQ